MTARRWYPVFLDLEGKNCLVVGGGTVAGRKVQGLLAAGARVAVVAPAVEEELCRLEAEKKITLCRRPFAVEDLIGVFFVIAATDDVRTQEAVHAEACKRGLLINVADVPGLCNVILPARLTRGAVSIAVGTGGASPALARLLKKKIGKWLGPEYSMAAGLLGALRPLVLGAGHGHRRNREIFSRLLTDDLLAGLRQGDPDKVCQLVLAELGKEGEDAARRYLATTQPEDGI